MKHELRGVRRAQHACIALLCVLMLLLAGCGQDQAGMTAASPGPGATQGAAASPASDATQGVANSPSPDATQVAAASSSPSPTVAPTATTGPTATPTPGPDEFTNPVIDQDFPDPDTLQIGDTYYAYATNSAGKNIQGARSTDLVNWDPLIDVLPVLPQWAEPGYTWAPEVTTWNDGETFVMYFTARYVESNQQCIGTAVSESPEGPFEATPGEPFICQLDMGGSIDAAAFEDEDGTQYVLWKNDGNRWGYPTWIYIQQVSEDGLTLEGEPVQLITNDQPWEGTLVEAPTLWKQDGKYHLFYSANKFAGADYATGYAVADAPTGPFTKPSGDPFIATDYETAAALGPGGQDIVLDPDGDTWMVYHSWDPTASYRRMQIDELIWEGDTPVLDGPDLGPQPRPEVEDR
jgi:arabinan endo-1,5-alpha-L-arabinosidase